MTRTGGVRRAIGLMSGTSMDGVDVGMLATDGQAVLRQGASASFAYTDDDRAVLRAALAEATTMTDRRERPGVLAEAERLVTLRHAEAVERFLQRHAIDPATVDVIGFHGQTVLHRPERRLTVQIGDGAALARRLGRPVVADFRAADVAAGGQGAPLVPAYHQALVAAAQMPLPVLVINIGGVANITFVSATGDPVACDTGPGNALIDDLMLARTGEPLDAGGAMAERGRVDEGVLAAMLAHAFFDQPPPKSLDRNSFTAAPVAALATPDAAATLTAFTAAAIAAIRPHLDVAPRAAVVCGGGAHNRTLMVMLAERLGCPVSPADQHGWTGDAIEAQAFAYLAVRSLDGAPLTYPTTTGGPRAATGGVLFRPDGA